MVDYTQFVDGLLHEPTQTEGRGLDLTAGAVYEVSDPGRVDFGGGELETAELSPHDTEQRNEDDEYEWWHLDEGIYLLEYNERLAVDQQVLTVQPRGELLSRGAFHPTISVTSLPKITLSVGGAGLKLKENARVSTIVATEPA